MTTTLPRPPAAMTTISSIGCFAGSGDTSGHHTSALADTATLATSTPPERATTRPSPATLKAISATGVSKPMHARRHLTQPRAEGEPGRIHLGGEQRRRTVARGERGHRGRQRRGHGRGRAGQRRRRRRRAPVALPGVQVTLGGVGDDTHAVEQRTAARERARRRAAGATHNRRDNLRPDADEKVVIGPAGAGVAVDEIEAEHPGHVRAERGHLQLGHQAQRQLRRAGAVGGVLQPDRVVGRPRPVLHQAHALAAQRGEVLAHRRRAHPGEEGEAVQPLAALQHVACEKHRIGVGARIERPAVAGRPVRPRHRQRERLPPHPPATLVGRPPHRLARAPARAADRPRATGATGPARPASAPLPGAPAAA